MLRVRSVIVLLLCNIFACVLAVELGVRYVVLKEARIFAYSPLTGWKPQANIDVMRSDVYGSWSVLTDEKGIRVASKRELATDPKWLIIGDSFAFGEGIEIEDRFDNVNSVLRGNSLNLGVMGYSPLQAFLRISEVGITPTNSNKILLLIYSNDEQDSRNYTSAYRRRPILESEGIIFPDSRWDKIHGYLRDSFYTYYLFYAFVLKPEVRSASTMFSQNLKHIARVSPSEIYFVFHGFEENEVDRLLEDDACQVAKCFKFSLNRRVDSDKFLDSDLHWNELGHREFSLFLSEKIFDSEKSH